MKKYLTVTILFAFISWSVTAQSIEPEVLATSGAHFVGTNAELSWTIGEVIIETVSNTGNIITQGFHQPNDLVTTVEESLPNHIQVNVFPNPVTEKITVTIDNNTLELIAVIYDMTGRQLISKKIGYLQKTIEFNVVDFANAGYLLNIHSKDKKYNATYKIQKLK